MLIGDLNRLDTTELQTQQRLGQIVNVPTHNNNILDQFLTNRPDLFTVEALQSSVKTRNKSLIINSKLDCAKAVQCPQRTTVKLLDYTPVVCCYLRQALAKYNWSGITAAIDCGNDDMMTLLRL